MNIILFFFLTTLAFAQTFTGDNFSIKYEETGVSKTGRKLTTIGQIDYSYPSRLKIEITSPDPAVVVINETGSWFYQPPFISKEKGLVTVSKRPSHPALKVFEALRNGLKNTDLYDCINDGKVISLVFKNKAKKDLGIDKIILKSSKGPLKIHALKDVEELQVYELKNTVKTWKFNDFKAEAKFHKEYFTFKIPENSKVQHQ